MYFVNSLEKWRQLMNLGKINLLGHSFGGFISSKYALYYPENLQKLVLFSPFHSEITTEEMEKEYEKNVTEVSYYQKLSYAFFKTLYKHNLTPFFWLRAVSRLVAGPFIYHSTRKEFKLPYEELKMVKEYIQQVFLQRGSGEYAFITLFPKLMFSGNAIFNHLDKYKEIDTSFYYGDRDWVNTNFGGKL